MNALNDFNETWLHRLHGAGARLLGAAVIVFVAFGVVAAPSPALADVTCPTDHCNTVFGWGRSNEGQTTTPTELTGKTVTAIAAGDHYSMALTSEGKVVAWDAQNLENSSCIGCNQGQADVPTFLADKTVTAIAAGDSHSLALTSEGEVVTWGGHTWAGDVPDSLKRIDAEGIAHDGKTVKAIAAGNNHSMALTEEGEIVAWGVSNLATVPTELADQTVTAIAAGDLHSMALTEEGEIVAWGVSNLATVPTELADQTVTTIVAGRSYSMALTEDGKVVAWGDNADGKATVPHSLKRIDAEGVEHDGKAVAAISAGADHALALTEEGEIVAWGNNNNLKASVPESLAGKTVTGIAAGGSQSLAIVDLMPLTTTVSAASQQVPFGESTTVSVDVSNPNVNAQQLTELTVSVPDGFVYEDDSSTGVEPEISENGRKLMFTGFDPIAPEFVMNGGHLTMSLGLKAVAVGEGTISIAGTTVSGIDVTPSSAELDAVPSEEPEPTPLTTSVSVDPSQVTVGETATVTVSITNPNDEVQELTSLGVLIPRGFTYVAGSTENASEPEEHADGRSLQFAFGSSSAGDAIGSSSVLLLPGAELKWSFKLQATDEGEDTLVVSPGQTLSGVDVTGSDVALKAVAIEPEEPETPPEQPTEPTPTTQPATESKTPESESENKLAKTGVGGEFTVLAVAATLLAAGIGLTMFSRRNHKDSRGSSILRHAAR